MAMWAGIIFYRSRDTAKKTPNNAVVLILLHLRPFLALIIIIIIITIYKAHNVRKKLNLRRRQSLGEGKSNSV